MAFGDNYATIEDLELRTGRTDDGTFDALLDTASRSVEAFTRRQFNKDTGVTPVATTRRYRPLDCVRLPVDDFHTLTSLVVEIGGTVVDAATYEQRPYGGIRNGLTGWPFEDLLRLSGRWSWNRRAKIDVTAHWGWAAVPEAIRQATLDVAAIMVYGGSASGPVRSEAIDGYSVSYQVVQSGAEGGASVPPELVKALPYRRVRFGVA